MFTDCEAIQLNEAAGSVCHHWYVAHYAHEMYRVCNVFSSDINSTELEARNPLSALRGGYAGYQNL